MPASMTFLPSQPPPCIYCAAPKTTDITPADALPTDRIYECASCVKRFIVRFIPAAPTRL